MTNTVMLQAATGEPDDEGIVVRMWQDVASVRGKLLPYGGDLAQKEYGVTQTVTYRFFTRQHHPAWAPGNRIIAGDKILTIVYVADYGKILDVLLNG